ncbi:hypothetical protein [Conexibacter woesei]|uniref:hypothetical protein n=1 Tax=Conexibacter woesei TaxID=191495 RepID=UPI0004109A00|nr:hypothetical protein [Conexibacter woesei]
MPAQLRPTGIPASGVSDDRNVAGDAVALTVFSTVRRWGLLELPLFFLVLRKAPRSLTTLRRLSFIQSARWSLLREIPYNGPPQPRVTLRHPHLYFESNFNGGWEEYIDAFSFLLTTGMFGFWGSSYGFPWALPSAPFKAYIREHAYTASHYYSAYPEATATIVQQALELEPKVRALCDQAPDLSPAEFAVAWRRTLNEVQQCL